MAKPLVEVKDLKKHFPVQKGWFEKNKSAIQAVNGVSFTIEEGETFGLVGESGCGKSTTGRMIMNLLSPSSGNIYFDGQEISSLSDTNLRNVRKNFQMVFQDPYASLNPRMKVKEIISEPLTIHKYEKVQKEKRVNELLDIVGLNKNYADRYPHEFSGGQRQRIGVARALALNPKLIIADEPVSALDVSIQSQILNLLQDLQEELGLTYLFISHDLSVMEHISDRVGVMYLGELVELAGKDMIYDHPKHPYTQALLSSIPIPDPTVKRERIILKGDIPSPANPPSGCRFHTRCPYAMEKCMTEKPRLKRVADGQLVACHLYD
ncbi:peptide ABC transporter substrate-binding protein [Virgibacillus phasianinus]|uniref:Peptide ABC transporter substrate-binding protein n=1 Tax=Virgibacillus phasianinus TaxID=2017483 RepID=A0A220U3C9_9BACI|nr:dipeptide ABC transporter ATP-binding protein [Virgibacillus phasianinus]ASK62331.1 peptide ABC transporter substrate-binding protein [Virgibacillus phasianinus]